MTRVLAAAVVVLMLLAGMAAAEPQPVDSDWQRSDGVPAEIVTPEDAPPETAEATEGEAAAGTAWLFYGTVCACELFAIGIAWLWWRRRRMRRGAA